MTSVSLLRATGPSPRMDSPDGTAALVLALVRARARRLALWMGQVWRAGQSSPDQGLAITAEEVTRLLAADAAAQDEVRFYRADAEAHALTLEIEDAKGALDRDPAWSGLVTAFDLDPGEADLMALLAAIEFDPGLLRVVAYLHDDTRLTAPTGALSQRLAGRAPGPMGVDGLVRWRLAEPLDGAAPHRPTTAWRIDPAVVAAIGGGWRDPATLAAVTVIPPEAISDLDCLQPAALASLRGASDLAEIELVGPAGIGRRTLAAQFAAQTGRPLVAADLPALVGRELEPREAIVRVLRQARATGALAYFRDAEAAPAAEWEWARALATPFLRGTREDAGARRRIVLEPLTLARRLDLWRARTGAPAPALLTTHRLSPAQIVRLAQTPVDLSSVSPGRPDHALLTALPRPYRWDDLVLPADVERQLRAFEDQVRLRWAVLEEWGFERLTHLGAGIAALFGGPSGTGKTMAAQVIARSLDLELYRVDLAGVVNKYVGETEKKLREVFDACEHSGALLFFDEADALFGGRMQVKDAHDRFANIEINYLLQRIETFDGVAILATNRRGDIDQAFVRRLRFVIEFLAPRPEERLALWRRSLSAKSPAGEDILGEIDFSLLAERLQMTGAEIKNTALAAAYLAKARGVRIGMDHLLEAAERELAKQGNRLRLPGRDGAAR